MNEKNVRAGKEVTVAKTLDGWEGEADNESQDVLREVRTCSYHQQFSAAIAASTTKLPRGVTPTERAVHEKLARQFHGQTTPRWYRTLLFGDLARRLNKPEIVALVKLVRRGLIQVYRVRERGGGETADARHLWVFEPITDC